MYWHKILKLKYNRIFAILMSLVLMLGTTVSFAADEVYDLSYQPPGDDPDTFYHWAEFDGVFWEVNRPEGSAGTGVFDSFLRIQANGTERGYNTDGPTEFQTKTGTWTHAITMSEIPYGTATVDEGTPDEMTYSGFEFMIDINESKNTPIMNVEQYEFWLTGDPNLTGYNPTGTGYNTRWSTSNEEPVWIGEIDWDFGEEVEIDRQLIMDYLVNSGSGAADYRVLIPEDYFFDALARYNAREGYVDLVPETAYLVLYVEHSKADAGFEEWGVRVVEKGALTITKNFSGYPMGYVLPEVIVNVSNGMGYSQDVPLNMDNGWTATLSGLMPGTYTVTEYDVEGWTTSYPLGSSVEVMADMIANIEIDNDFDLGYLKLIKTWSGEPEGFDDYPDSVTGTITGPFGYDEDFEIFPDEFGVWEEIIGPLPPGNYTVSEDDVEGWSTTLIPADGVIEVLAGEESEAVSLSIINDFDLGYLKLIKTWSGEPEGFDDYPDSVTGTITGPFGYDETFSITPDEFGVWEEIIGPLPPGNYTVSEDDVEGWSTTLIPADGVIEVLAGEESEAVSLSIINDFDLGYLKLIKTWSGEPEGFDDYPDSVTGTITGPFGYDETFVIFPDEFGVWEEIIGPLPPGDYTVSEDDVEGWSTTLIPADGVIEVLAGEESEAVSLSIINDFDLGYLKLIKTWSGEPEGFDDYPDSVTGTITGPFGYSEEFELFGPDWEDTFGPLPPGTYTVSEVSIEGWTTSYPYGSSIEVVAGTEEDAVEIEINNDYNLMLMDETAWGYLSGESEENWDYVKNNNWGWTTEITESGFYKFDLYAAAGQNILSNGFKVGVVEVEVTEVSDEGMFDVEVTYIIDEDLDYDYWLDEAHVWIGETPLPIMKNGKMTNALGQFNYDPHISSDGLEAHLTVEDVEGPFWIALHGVVQWWE